MKARKLRKILNDTKYIVSNNREYIAVGSSLCHKLISVDKRSLKLTYALDTFNKGREAIQHEELCFIWDKLTELIKSGEILEIIDGDDIIENPISVFCEKDGKILEKFTEKFEWPNTTHDGYVLYENAYFKTKQEAVAYGIKNSDSYIKWCDEKLRELDTEMRKIKAELEKHLSQKNSYENVLKEVQDVK